jgi:hypothetical protein
MLCPRNHPESEKSDALQKKDRPASAIRRACAKSLLSRRSLRPPICEEPGEGGIRTLDTLLGYGALAKRCFQPLSHLTKIGSENIAKKCGLPIADC